MSRYIRISCVAPQPYAMDLGKDLDACVDEMIIHWDRQLEPVLCDKPDLIVLPEACDRAPNFPLDHRLKYYDIRKDRIRDHFTEIAKANHCNIAYSSAKKADDGSYRNCTQFLNRKGGIDGVYSKNYLVIDEYHESGIIYGKDASVIQTDFGTVGGVICFDLNFDELRERYIKNPPELLVFSSMYHGGLMQNYWAYSCRSYFVSAVAGSECTVINPLGERIARSTNYYPYITADINLDYQVLHIDYNGKKFTEAKKKYGDKIKIFDPGYLGSVLLTSETDEFSAKDIVNEFEMELLNDYFTRSIKERYKPGRMEP